MNYLITEMELLGLCINISEVKHLLAKVNSDCTVDHLALVYIKSTKTEPGIAKIKRRLEVLNAYQFNLYFMK